MKRSYLSSQGEVIEMYDIVSYSTGERFPIDSEFIVIGFRYPSILILRKYGYGMLSRDSYDSISDRFIVIPKSELERRAIQHFGNTGLNHLEIFRDERDAVRVFETTRYENPNNRIVPF